LPPEFTELGRPKFPQELDGKFEEGLTAWLINHPLLNKQEQSDPRILGAVNASNLTPAQINKLPPNTPVRSRPTREHPEGEIFWTSGPSAAGAKP
jgi:hypothetical protein